MRTFLQTPTNELAHSLDYFGKLNYKCLSAANPTLVTDGQLLLEINPDRFARPGIKIYQNSWDAEIIQLEKHTQIHKIEGGFLLSSPSGVWVYLMEGESPIDSEMQAALAESSFGLTGNYAGVSLETTDIHRSTNFWNILGFEKTMGSVDQGWIAFQDSSGVSVSLMIPNSCPHLFFNPSLTFFNGKKNEAIIAAIRAVGIPIAEEVTHFNKEGKVDNIILLEPGGWGMFLFND